MNQLKTAALASVFALMSASVAVAGPVSSEVGPNLVVNGGFETGDFTGWTRSGNGGFTSVDTASPHSGSFGVDVGPVGSLGFIDQDIATVAGQNYNIHAWFRSSGDHFNEFRVDWGGVTVLDLVNPAAFSYTEFVIDPSASGPLTNLRIGFRNDPSFDQFDDISVRLTTVPEPGSLALLGIALLGLGFARRKSA